MPRKWVCIQVFWEFLNHIDHPRSFQVLNNSMGSFLYVPLVNSPILLHVNKVRKNTESQVALQHRNLEFAIV